MNPTIYGVARYVWDGSTDVQVRLPSIAGVRYLPMMRDRLAPYGTEWSFVNELGGRIRPMRVRTARRPFASQQPLGHCRPPARRRLRGEVPL